MKKGKLSDRQSAILVFIQDQVSANGFPPTIRQIGEACGIASTSVVNYNLNKLATSGYLMRTKGQSRGLRLTRQALALREVPVTLAVDGMLSVPHVGRIVASAPVPHPGDDFGYYFDAEDLIEVPRQLINANETAQLYALTVSGHSMIDAMIDDGDTVILKRQAVADNGDMVAVWLSDKNETTLKRFFDEGDRVRLQPANPTMDPIYVPKDRVEIQGRVLAVMRKVA
ncbi:MAG: transcriptional repressor LexA [Aggregatilineales bacterium]